MKLEVVQEQLKRWGEVMIRTASGEEFELHLGDTTIDLEKRLISFKTTDAEYFIDGDSVERVMVHWSHKD
ncbi:MAG: hypothetical protein IMX00_08920 [Limnochordales bacterium]|nr:hypothetical protein [Limnochordales bacterium]